MTISYCDTVSYLPDNDKICSPALFDRFRKTGYGIYDCRVVDAVGDAEVAGAAEGAAGNDQDILF